MPHPFVSKRVFVLLSCLLSFLVLISTGCKGKKRPAKKDYGKPTWLEVDPSQLAKVSEYETTLEGGKILVYDPEGWERAPRGAAKPPKGFKSIIVFQKDGATILMTKSRDVKEIPNLDEDNIEEFAEGAQQRFKSSVRMVKLGDKVGVFFSRRVADSQRLSKFYDRRIVATSIDGQLYTYELVDEPGKIDSAKENTLFAVIAATKIIPGNESESPTESASVEEPVLTDETTTVVATETLPAPVVREEEKSPTEPEAKADPPIEAKTPAKKAEKKPAKPKKKGNTSSILDELDALLN